MSLKEAAIGVIESGGPDELLLLLLLFRPWLSRFASESAEED